MVKEEAEKLNWQAAGNSHLLQIWWTITASFFVHSIQIVDWEFKGLD